MPSTPHVEQHFTAGLAVRDAVIGLADGLTVPFALAAGLTGAVDSTALVVTAGLAEIAAGSIAMGLGGYMAGTSAVDSDACWNSIRCTSSVCSVAVSSSGGHSRSSSFS